MKKEIKDRVEKILKFIGATKSGSTYLFELGVDDWGDPVKYDYPIEATKFHRSFDWLVPVFVKALHDRHESYVTFGDKWCEITVDGSDFNDLVEYNGKDRVAVGYERHFENINTELAMFDCLVNFIDWYNKPTIHERKGSRV